MFDWLKRLLSDPPAASLPGDIANPPTVVEPSIEPTQAECIKEAEELLMEAIEILDWSGVPFEDIEGIVGDAVSGYWEEIYGEDEDDDDSWFPGKEYGSHWDDSDDDDDDDDDGCDCSIDCECPDCSDADDDHIEP